MVTGWRGVNGPRGRKHPESLQVPKGKRGGPEAGLREVTLAVTQAAGGHSREYVAS